MINRREAHRRLRAPERRRTRRSTTWRAMGLVGLAGVVASATLSSTPTPAAATAPTSAGTSISLSGGFAVKPGEPVPLKLVKDKSKREFAGANATGQGIDVALIDSGVSPVRGLDRDGKVLYGPDLSNEGSNENVRNLDTFGHGTHMAGIIAGDDGDQVDGIAPSSRIVSVKVAGATGETDVAQVIAAIDWVVEHKNDNGLNIRVLNLSLGLPDVKTNVGDPLSAAVERAWNAGIVVVAAAGNRGNLIGGVDSPAVSPYVIAVGGIESYDADGTTDAIASWSSNGNAFREPDVVAPGRSIMSYRVPGSMLDTTYPQARVGDRYFVGSGTSQSAAVVSGFAAALLSRQPRLSPDQVKFLFESQAVDMAKLGFLDGDGKINPKDTARNIRSALLAPVQGYPLAITGIDMKPGDHWSGGAWNGASWSGGAWSGASWSGASWSGASWSGASWSGASWSGASWSGASWSGASWSGASWSGASWSGASWSGEVWG